MLSEHIDDNIDFICNQWTEIYIRNIDFWEKQENETNKQVLIMKIKRSSNEKQNLSK